MIAKHLFEGLLSDGSLRVIDATGKHTTYGKGEPQIAIRFTDRLAPLQLLLNPDLRLGELYMDGRLVVEQGDIASLLSLLMRNLAQVKPRGWHKHARHVRTLLRRLRQLNTSKRAKTHVAHHYDLSHKLYQLFLDRDLQYSCAYFAQADDSLETAQQNKKLHIVAKLKLDRPNLKVLDIGCGFGGMGLTLAEQGCRVLGITLSEEQIAIARRRARDAGAEERLHFSLADYRELTGCYDRIVSVGMFEHVGVAYYDTFFRKASHLLADDGVMLLHSIGRSDGPGSTNPWITKYIFPGGYVPSLSEIAAAIEKSGLIITDVEVLRLHYAETLKEWRRRFTSRRDEVLTLFDERFFRMWEFYLAGSEMAFRHDSEVVFQIQIAKRQESLPLTRDYLLQYEAALRQAAQ